MDAHVFGDVDTPVTEVVNGETRLINDCRVHDRLTFLVPEILDPVFTNSRCLFQTLPESPLWAIFSAPNAEFIRVATPSTARFQIVTDRIIARKETSPGLIGSDEVGLHTVAFPAVCRRDFQRAAGGEVQGYPE